MWSALVGIGIFAVVMALLMIGVSVVAAAAEAVFVRRLRASASSIQRVAAVVMVLVGGALIYFSISPEAFRSIFFPD
ncbi:MAG: hypothetical protein HY682_00355 [Chloroflexi bacterium]|nr:hypothetical protein [Chloroflexota bacterium]